DELDVAGGGRARSAVGQASAGARLSHALEDRFHGAGRAAHAQRMVRVGPRLEGRDGAQDARPLRPGAGRNVRGGGGMTRDPAIRRAMTRLRRALEKRMRMDERAEELRRREGRPIRPGELAAYDTAALGRRLRPMLEYDGRGWRELAAEIGVTSPDLSRVMAGQDVSAAKVF